MKKNRIELPVHGMKCQKCLAKVTAVRGEVPGAETATVSL